MHTEVHLGHQKKKLLSCPGKIIILPGQDNYALICLGKIIILPGQDNCTLSCLGKITTHQFARAR